MLKTNRGMLKFCLLSLITFGIYGLCVMTNVSDEINRTAKDDGKNTMNFLLAFLVLGPVTFGIYPLVWMHNICVRIGDRLAGIGSGYSIGAGTFWGWFYFGSLLLGIGPLVFFHKFFKAVNIINKNYNDDKIK